MLFHALARGVIALFVNENIARRRNRYALHLVDREHSVHVQEFDVLNEFVKEVDAIGIAVHRVNVKYVAAKRKIADFCNHTLARIAHIGKFISQILRRNHILFFEDERKTLNKPACRKLLEQSLCTCDNNIHVAMDYACQSIHSCADVLRRKALSWQEHVIARWQKLDFEPPTRKLTRCTLCGKVVRDDKKPQTANLRHDMIFRPIRDTQNRDGRESVVQKAFLLEPVKERKFFAEVIQFET